MHYAKILIALCCVNFASGADKEPAAGDYEGLSIQINLPSPSNSLSPSHSRHRSVTPLSPLSPSSTDSSADSSISSLFSVHTPSPRVQGPGRDRCDDCVEACCVVGMYGCISCCVGLTFMGIMATFVHLAGRTF